MSMDSLFSSPALLLKIIIPSENTSKTIRIETKTKVCELQERIKKKMSTTASQVSSEVDTFGLFWYSDSGPVWLADASTLKSYNMKNGDSLEFKKRPPKLSRAASVQPAPTYLSTSADAIPRGASTPTVRELPEIPRLASSSRQTIATIKSPASSKPKSNLWVPVRPGSAYGLLPQQNAKALPLPPTPPSSSQPLPVMSDLDGLIDSFDDQWFDGENVGATDKDSTLHNIQESDDNDDNGSLSFNLNKSKSESQLDTYEYSSRDNEASVHDEEASTDDNSGSNYDFSSFPQASMNIFNKAQQQKMIENKVNMRVIETILTDALGGIEAGVVDMDLVKMYISSVLSILRNIS